MSGPPKRAASAVFALQRYRIGPNFRFVEVNRPRCPLHTNAQDGPLNIANQTGEINYFPSEFSNQVGLHAVRGQCIRSAQFSCIAVSNTPSLPVMSLMQDALQLLSTHAQSDTAPYNILRYQVLRAPCYHIPSWCPLTGRPVDKTDQLRQALMAKCAHGSRTVGLAACTGSSTLETCTGSFCTKDMVYISASRPSCAAA